MDKSKDIYNFLLSKNITELVHLTNISNIDSISKFGILSMDLLDKQAVDYYSMDKNEKSNKDYINLSITNPNIEMIHDYTKKGYDHQMIVISINPKLLKDLPSNRYKFVTPSFGFLNDSFSSVEELFIGDRYDIEENVTTDNRSRVMVSDRIDLKYITKIYVSSMNHIEKLSKLFPNAIIELKSVMNTYQERVLDKNIDQVNSQIDLYNKLHSLVKNIKNNVLTDINNLESYSSNFLNIQKVVKTYYLDNWFPDRNVVEIIENISEDSFTAYNFESFATKRDFLSTINDNTDVFEKNWRIIFNRRNTVQHLLSDNDLASLSIMEKILNRGTITCISPKLERVIVESYPKDEQQSMINYVHRVQVSIVELIKRGVIKNGDTIGVEGVSVELFDSMSKEMLDLDKNVSLLYQSNRFLSIDSFKQADSAFTFSNSKYGEGFILILDSDQETVTKEYLKTNGYFNLSPSDSILEYFLYTIFGYEKFRGNQSEAIKKILRKEDTIVLLPTGAGKSIIYQLSALLLPGITIVVDPIVSLAIDQVENLKARGIDRVVEINSKTKSTRKIYSNLVSSQYSMIFVSPERFQNLEFREYLQKYCQTNYIPIVAIDEAHCVSEWGHDFRTSYLNIANTCRKICYSKSSCTPVVVGLTGTASSSVLRDIQRDLNIDEKDTLKPESFDRKELNFRVINVPAKKKNDYLIKIIENDIPKQFRKSFKDFYSLKGEFTNSGIVFSLFAGEESKKNGTRAVQSLLNNKYGNDFCGAYNGKMDDLEKTSFASKFKNNKIGVLSATKSYGMGIDKPNIRWSVHTSLPMSIEAFYQEVGRCARDGKPSVSWLILSNNEVERNNAVLNVSKTSVNNINKVMNINKYDDIDMAMFLYKSSFKGVESELEILKYVLIQIQKGSMSISFKDKILSELEKAIYRLTMLGYLNDYTINHISKEIVLHKDKFSSELIVQKYVNYISTYQMDEGYIENQVNLLNLATKQYLNSEHRFIYFTVKTLLKEFVYKIIEEGRRNALRNMLYYGHEASRYSNKTKGGEFLKSKILDYLSTSDTIDINEIINNPTDFIKLVKISKSIKSKKTMKTLLPQILRSLESYPENIGLHFIIMVLASRIEESKIAVESYTKLLGYAINSYGIGKNIIFKHILNNISDFKMEAKDAEDLLIATKDYVGDYCIELLKKKFKSNIIETVYDELISTNVNIFYDEIASEDVNDD